MVTNSHALQHLPQRLLAFSQHMFRWLRQPSHGLRSPCKPPQKLLDSLDDDLKYAIEVEGGMAVTDMSNYGEVRSEIAAALEGLRDVPAREETPLIYHLDVAAMYPNIILTNRWATISHPVNSGSSYKLQCCEVQVNHLAVAAMYPNVIHTSRWADV